MNFYQLHHKIRSAIIKINENKDSSLRFYLTNSLFFFKVEEITNYTTFQVLRIMIAHYYLTKLGGANVDKLKLLLTDNSIESEEGLQQKLSVHSFFGFCKTKSEQAFDAVKEKGVELTNFSVY